jgi:hypothetical protein
MQRDEMLVGIAGDLGLIFGHGRKFPGGDIEPSGSARQSQHSGCRWEREFRTI